MSKVLLFVQNEGDKRPKRVRCKVSRHTWLAGCFTGSSNSGVPFHGFFVHKTTRGLANRADRWWLVEAKSAEKGRRVIVDYENIEPGLPWRGQPISFTNGRILASGGRA